MRVASIISAAIRSVGSVQQSGDMMMRSLTKTQQGRAGALVARVSPLAAFQTVKEPELTAQSGASVQPGAAVSTQCPTSTLLGGNAMWAMWAMASPYNALRREGEGP
jgi:hypothetical protein